MTSRVFGLRAAQFSGLLQPAPTQQVHRHRVLRRRPQRVDARVGSIGRDIVAHDDPDARRRLFPFHNRGALCSGCVPAAKGMRSSAAVQGESRCKRPACDTDRTACCRQEREDRNPFDEPDHLLPADSGYMCKAFSRLRGVDPDQPERAAREPKVRRLPTGGSEIRTLGPPVYGELAAPGRARHDPWRHRESPERRSGRVDGARRAICGRPGAPFTWTMPTSSLRSASDGFEHLAALFFAFSATFEICRDDRIVTRGECQNSGRKRIP
jgi:hypothetical protein